jgi:hypothetical protein
MRLPSLIRNHPFLSSLLSAAVFVVVSFPLWLAGVWTLVSDRPFAVAMAERQWGLLVVGPVYGWFCLMLGIGLVGLCVAILVMSTRRASIIGPEWDERRQTIYRRAYTNETVEIDGIYFEYCTFTNVSLTFHGSAPCGFVECKFHGSTMLQSDHPAVKAFLSLSTRLRSSPMVEKFQYGEKDATTGEVRLFAPLETKFIGQSDQQSNKLSEPVPPASTDK